MYVTSFFQFRKNCLKIMEVNRKLNNSQLKLFLILFVVLELWCLISVYNLKIFTFGNNTRCWVRYSQMHFSSSLFEIKSYLKENEIIWKNEVPYILFTHNLDSYLNFEINNQIKIIFSNFNVSGWTKFPLDNPKGWTKLKIQRIFETFVCNSHIYFLDSN